MHNNQLHPSRPAGWSRGSIAVQGRDRGMRAGCCGAPASLRRRPGMAPPGARESRSAAHPSPGRPASPALGAASTSAASQLSSSAALPPLPVLLLEVVLELGAANSALTAGTAGSAADAASTAASWGLVSILPGNRKVSVWLWPSCCTLPLLRLGLNLLRHRRRLRRFGAAVDRRGWLGRAGRCPPTLLPSQHAAQVLCPSAKPGKEGAHSAALGAAAATAAAAAGAARGAAADQARRGAPPLPSADSRSLPTGLPAGRQGRSIAPPGLHGSHLCRQSRLRTWITAEAERE